jgi:hypothetical protein
LAESAEGIQILADEVMGSKQNLGVAQMPPEIGVAHHRAALLNIQRGKKWRYEKNADEHCWKADKLLPEARPHSDYLAALMYRVNTLGSEAGWQRSLGSKLNSTLILSGSLKSY